MADLFGSPSPAAPAPRSNGCVRLSRAADRYAGSGEKLMPGALFSLRVRSVEIDAVPPVLNSLRTPVS